MNLNATIIPKSTQINADDLIGGPRTIKITAVQPFSAEQPVAINFDGDNGRPYLPSKSMRRVFVQLWGSEGAAYVGRRVTIYRDPTVKFGGDDVGGIKISHASDIPQTVSLMLTATRGKRKPHVVEPLAPEAPARDWKAEVAAAEAASGLKDWAGKLTVEEKKEWWNTLSGDEKKAYKEKIV